MRLQNSFLILSYHKYMSKKTVKRHYKKHRRSYRKSDKKHFKRTYKKKRTYRKRFKRRDKGTEKGIQIFTEPKKMHSQSISVTPFQSGNMIPGLRNM